MDNALLNEIREVNLSYLVLTQQMVRDNKAEAMLRLGLSKEVIDVLAMLTSAQLVRLADSNMLLCRFRFDDHLILSALTHNARREDCGNLQAAVLLAQQPVEELQ
jgi:flagellar transcriptional activator FlhD